MCIRDRHTRRNHDRTRALMAAVAATGVLSGELLGEPGPQLRAVLAGSGVRVLTPLEPEG